MNKYVEITAYAEGHYSGMTHDEVIYLPYNVYEKIKDSMRDWFSAGELDGKHSEVDGSVDIKMIEESEFRVRKVKFTDDELYIDDLESIIEDNNLDLDIYDIAINTRSYLNRLNIYETMEIKFKKEHKDKILTFLNDLK